MQSDNLSTNGGWRHPWPWYLKRGLGFFGLGFGLAWGASWVHALWLGWVGFGLGVVGMWMLTIASGEARRAYRAEWWGWYRTAYERNVRKAEHQRDGESPPPQPPNDR